MAHRSENIVLVAWMLSLISSLAVLFIGEVLGQIPCSLCWFQRAFMFPLAIVLGLGVWWRDPMVARYGVILAAIGAVIALWHLGVFYGLTPENIRPCSASGPSCSGSEMTVLGLPIPLLSLVAFGAIATLLILSLRKNPNE